MSLTLPSSKARNKVNVADHLAIRLKPFAQHRQVCVRCLVQDRDAPVVLDRTRWSTSLLDDARCRHAGVELDHAGKGTLKGLPLIFRALRADPVLRQARMAVKSASR